MRCMVADGAARCEDCQGWAILLICLGFCGAAAVRYGSLRARLWWWVWNEQFLPNPLTLFAFVIRCLFTFLVLHMQTYYPTREEALASRRWLLVDAAGQTVGRLASQVAAFIRGKHKPTFTPHNDMGDFVVVINAAQARFTGAKTENKKYYHHSGYAGGIKERSAAAMFATNPERVIELAVGRMLPRGPLGFQMRTKLKVFAGADHPHTAQRPEKVELTITKKKAAKSAKGK